MRVILVPADEQTPCRLVTVPDRTWEQSLCHLLNAIGLEPGTYDHDVQLQVGLNSSWLAPVNRRATRYVFGHSEAAARQATDPDQPPQWLHGDIAVLGTDDRGRHLQQPPARMFALFGVTDEQPPPPGDR